MLGLQAWLCSVRVDRDDMRCCLIGQSLFRANGSLHCALFVAWPVWPLLVQAVVSTVSHLILPVQMNVVRSVRLSQIRPPRDGSETKQSQHIPDLGRVETFESLLKRRSRPVCSTDLSHLDETACLNI